MSSSFRIRTEMQFTVATWLLIIAAVGCHPVETVVLAADTSATERSQRGPTRDGVYDIEGNRHRPLAPASPRFRVITFVTTDCPVANAFQPTLRKLAEEFSDAQIDFYQVNPARSATIEKSKQHVFDFGISSPMILDPNQSIAARLGAKVTPETFLLSPSGDVLYRGRIDDLYVGFGKKRQMPTVHDLRDAIVAALDSRPISTPITKPIGCIIQYEGKNLGNSR